MKLSTIIIWTVSAAICSCYPSSQPVIGVLLETVYNSPGHYKAMADYKSFIEQGGAAAVPIFVNQTDEYYKSIMSRINGVLLPGGGVNLLTSFYARVAYKIFQMATKINDAGIHFPIMAICLGMEEMTTWTFKPRQIVASSCPGAENISLPLHFTKNASSSRLLGNLPSNIAQYLTTENVTANNHKNCVYMKTYFSLPQLNQFYNVLTTNLDGNGVEYASTIEAKSYPFFALQWHPEKPNFFHHLNMAYNRSLHAILIGQHFSNVLVEQAKMNRQSFKSVHEEKLFLFNNYCTTFSDTFSEYYYFTDADVPKFE